MNRYRTRIAYFRLRYAENRDAAIAAARAYRKRNRAAIKLSLCTGVSIPAARRMLQAEQRI